MTLYFQCELLEPLATLTGTLSMVAGIHQNVREKMTVNFLPISCLGPCTILLEFLRTLFQINISNKRAAQVGHVVVHSKKNICLNHHSIVC